MADKQTFEFYSSPQVEVIEVNVEKGFATSYESEELSW